MSEAEMLLEEKMKKKKEEDEEMWREYIEQRKAQRAKEDEDLRKLKERQAKRRAARAEQEKAMMEYKKRSDEHRARELEEKKIKEIEAKKKRLEEAEKKRQAMQAAKERKEMEPAKPNFSISATKKDTMDMGSALGASTLDKFANIMHARGEMGKTKEQLEEDKFTILSMRVTPLAIEGMSVDDLKKKAKELWERIVTLESDKYDLEEKQKRQEYDLKELAERQRQINRNKALKKGLDPEALSGKYPPKIQVASKYERRTDRRTYDDKKELFSGGFEASTDAELEKIWEDKMMAFKEREGPKELPKWDPENPKNKQTYDRERAEIDDDDEEIPIPVFKPPEEYLAPPPPAPAPEPEPEEEEEEEEAEEEEEEEEEEE